MSKSLGNSLLLEDLLKKYTNEAIKFALLGNNYRNDINITILYAHAVEHIFNRTVGKTAVFFKAFDCEIYVAAF